MISQICRALGRRRTPAACVTAIAAGLLAGGVTGAHDLVPAPPQTEPIAIVGATIHPVCGPVIEHGTILFENGRIQAIGSNLELPVATRTLDGEGKHVYPGLIAANTTMGLVEISNVRATLDHKEVGILNPGARAEVAFNPDSEHIPVVRANGVLSAVSMPAGGLISGTAALMRLDGWTWEDLTIKAPVGLMINWPPRPAATNARDDEAIAKARENRAERLDTLRRAFEDARAYLRARDAAGAEDVPRHDIDQRWEAMLPVLRGEIPVLVRAANKFEIDEAVAWATQEGLKMVLLGGPGAHLSVDLLREHDIAVIVTRVLRLPTRRDADYDAPFVLARKLHEAGVRFAIARSHSPTQQNLPDEAAMAAAFGLPPEEALRAITLYPARILGVDDELGSLAPGLAATLFVASNDILEITARVEHAFIDGREIDLDDRHKALHRKYREKYRRMGLIR